jgi:hypothetical protein
VREAARESRSSRAELSSAAAKLGKIKPMINVIAAITNRFFIIIIPLPLYSVASPTLLTIESRKSFTFNYDNEPNHPIKLYHRFHRGKGRDYFTSKKIG